MMIEKTQYSELSEREQRFLLGGTDADSGGSDGGIVILPTDSDEDDGNGG